jgi:hypothetical protein
MRHVLTALACLLLLAGCVATPKPFEHDAGNDEPFRPKQDKVEVAVATPANMPDNMARRVATLMGKPPVFEARAPGQVAAGANNPPIDETPPVQTAATTGTPASQPAGAAKPQAPSATPRQTKVMVGSIEGAPSDGNRQLLGGMRRALGSSRIVVMDSAGADTFVVSAKVKLTPTDERTGQLDLTWFLKDPSGREIGKIDQSNPVPLAATRGSWAGFGDIVAQAAVEGIVELIEQATKKPQ